jgi:hypothetical protein
LIIDVLKEVPPASLIKNFWRNSRSEEQVQIFHFYQNGGGGVDVLLGSLALEFEAGTLFRSIGKTLLFIATVQRN